MLTRLYIKDFALIEEVDIEFDRGLNVITGETGAGKSILMGALYSILGGKTGADLVRRGAERCLVEGLFEFADHGPAVTRLRELDAEPDDGQLIVRREIRADGRSRAFVNELAIPLKRLKQLGTVLADLHGQHEHQSLLDTRLHLLLLDAFGGLTEQRENLTRQYRTYRRQEQSLAALRRECQALREQEELRLFELRQIRQLAPEPGEEESLERELQLQENAQQIVQTCAQICDVLYQADGSVVEQLGRTQRQLTRLLEIDPSLGSQVASLEELVFKVEDLSTALRDHANHLDIHPQRAEQLRERLDELRRLRKKHGGSLEKVLERARELEVQENRATALDSQLRSSETELQKTLENFAHDCLTLSKSRHTTAAAFSQAVEHGLHALGMPQTRFRAELTVEQDADGLVQRPDGCRWRANEHGLETVEFFIAPNPGEELRPLARIASGGEVSRIMLALKEVLAGQDAVPTLVFDEIDVGISGRIAAAVGNKLRALSASHQLLVITHLPQIASVAEKHFSVRKRQSKDRTITEVLPLTPKDRAEEIARLLAGETISETARQHAREMLK